MHVYDVTSDICISSLKIDHCNLYCSFLLFMVSFQIKIGNIASNVSINKQIVL